MANSLSHSVSILDTATNTVAEEVSVGNTPMKVLVNTVQQQDAPQGVLENPQPNSFQSGIGLLSGWVCEASVVELELDGTRVPAAYGTSREDTRPVCNDANNGFGLLFNWNLLGNGPHTIRALADGVVFAEAAVQVTTLSSEFLEGVSGQYELANFPQAGRTVAVQWQESLQNFVITAVEETDGGLPPPPPPPPPM